jgi:hypothetical protein
MFAYNAAGVFSSVTRPDGSPEQLTPLVMKGLALSTPGISVVQTIHACQAVIAASHARKA